jgi:TetR/AcrR family transcriptional repressor of nem operon
MPRTGRPRTFDEDAVVEQAKQVFWAHGFEGTSVQELVDATGLQRGSLYGAFTDKHGLFLRALGRYADEARSAAAELVAAPTVMPALRAFMLAGIRATAPHPGRGCLLANTVGELLPQDELAAAAVHAVFRDLELALTKALERARSTGEIPARGDVAAQARMLVALLEGLQVVAKTEPDSARLADAVDAALAMLG